jgi:hypothetical protein
MSEANITRKSIAEIRANIASGGDRTDWARVDAMTDEEIEAAMRDDPDWKDHVDDDWSGAQLVSSTLQSRVQPWMMACFGAEIANDKLERGDRFIEEALELLQAADYPRDRIYQLIAYVYGRPKGEMHQEIGGVMITLAAFCLAHGYDMHHAGEQELERIWTKVEAIRAKQAAKPTGSSLPVAVSGPVDIAAENARLRAALESLVQSGKQVDIIKIKPIDWKTDGRSMWEDADFPRYDLYRASSGGFWLAYADRTIRYSPNERDFPSEESAKAAAQAHKEKRIRAEIDHAAPIATVAIMGVGGARYLMPHPPGSCDDIPVGMPLYACPVFNDENARLREALEKCVVALEALWRTGVNGYAEEIEIARAALKGGAV